MIQFIGKDKIQVGKKPLFHEFRNSQCINYNILKYNIYDLIITLRRVH